MASKQKWNGRQSLSALIMQLFSLSLCFQVSLALLEKPHATPNYFIGAGIADITGPAAEVNMMGYANPLQTAHGIHLRQYSRAFIILDKDKKMPVVFVSTDSCMLSQGVKLEVIRRLKQIYGDLYTERNVCLSGTHTHSGPGGFHQYLLFDITSLGFVKESFEALVAGIVESISAAHKSIQPGNIYINQGELLESNINRSPSAYLNNPPEERARYKYDVDKNMTLLLMVDASGAPIGLINWFAVHCTSVNNTNRMISSDNKGYASQLMEKLLNIGAPPGQGKFVAAFAQSNEGDVSPNTRGPHCQDTGLPCDIATSTCNGRNELCVASGPGVDMYDSARIIAENQFNMAKQLAQSATEMLEGPVDFRHSYVDFTSIEVQINATTKVKTCKPSMGYSFAAGTIDGPGAFNFTQGTTSGNAFWNFVRGFIREPTKEQTACQHPKPILLDTGEVQRPYPWQPDILDTQIFQIGDLVIAAVPAEFTTMAGRRTRDSIISTLQSLKYPVSRSVIARLANDYADYVATFEEYQVQRYEAASTLYGPHTLNAFIQQYIALVKDLAAGTPSPPGPNPPNLLDRQLTFLPPVIFDAAPIGKKYGDVTVAPSAEYKQGSRVEVKFVSGNPRNDIRRNSTFLAVMQQQTSGDWKVVATDSVWETRFQWFHTNELLGESEATVIWDIPTTQDLGTYHICHYGSHKSITGTITPFSGCTDSFQVTAK